MRWRLIKLEAIAAVGAQRSQQAGGGALCGGGGIVELVRQIAGELAEGGKLFRLLLDARDLADAVEERGDDSLGHGGNGREHLREERAVDEQRPHGRDGESLAAVALHAREGQHAGHLSGAADEERHRAAVLAAHVNLALEDEDHVLGRSAFFEQDVAGIGHVFLAVTGEPHAFLEGQAVEGADVLEGVGDFFGRCGSRRCDNGGGKHAGDLRVLRQDSRWADGR